MPLQFALDLDTPLPTDARNEEFIQLLADEAERPKEEIEQIFDLSQQLYNTCAESKLRTPDILHALLLMLVYARERDLITPNQLAKFTLKLALLQEINNG